jgi:hypothetical protein
MRPAVTSMLLASGLVVTTGCSAFLPAHINSHVFKGERVQITMLTWKDMEGDSSKGTVNVQPDYMAVFPEVRALKIEQEEKARFAFAAPAAAAAIGLAIDYVKKRLDEEATLYEAQFSQRIAADGFWIRGSAEDPWEQHYYGFEVARYAENGTEPAYQLLCGLAVSKDGKMLKVAPLYFVTRKAKVKVLGKRGWSFLWDWALRTGDEIESHADIAIDAIYVNGDGEVETIALTSFPIDIGQYPLASGDGPYRVLRKAPGKDAGLLETAPAGWFGGVPLSKDIASDKTQAGTFWVGATVTEKDPSNAKRYLETASKSLDEHREKIIKIVTDKVGGK